MGSAQGTASSTENGTHYTQAQLKQLKNGAHTPEQYKALADYYLDRQNNFLRQAAEEKQEWIRRSQGVMSVMMVAAKYPRPVDSSRIRYEYLTYKAAEAESQAEKYGQMAAQEPVHVR
jgi:hypothetical protein